MKAIETILFILDGYPVAGSNACVFAKNLIVELADLGVKCTVIAPQIITHNTIRHHLPYHVIDKTESGIEINIYFPLYCYASSRPSVLGISMNNHLKAVINTIQREHIQFDVVYGHFIYLCGLTAALIGNKYDVPSFLSVGESDKLLPGNTRNHGAYQVGINKYKWKDILSLHSGIICVSEWTSKLLVDNGFTDYRDDIAVFPNGVNSRLFHPDKRDSVRKELGIPTDVFVVSFVGAFNENKGAKRVATAIGMIDEDIYSVFIGRDGNCRPECNNILFCGSCGNDIVARYLQASDCFVLPTRSEGCCNAILEALSTGLPVISSDLPFNDGILTDENSIRIDPNNIRSIAEAICTLKHDYVFRDKLSYGALCSAKRFDIKERAKRVYGFMLDIINKE